MLATVILSSDTSPVAAKDRFVRDCCVSAHLLCAGLWRPVTRSSVRLTAALRGSDAGYLPILSLLIDLPSDFPLFFRAAKITPPSTKPPNIATTTICLLAPSDEVLKYFDTGRTQKVAFFFVVSVPQLSRPLT